jgi:hypothetical protein
MKNSHVDLVIIRNRLRILFYTLHYYFLIRNCKIKREHFSFLMSTYNSLKTVNP